MSDRIIYTANDASGKVLYASADKKQTAKLIENSPGLTLGKGIVDVNAVAGPIIAKLTPEERAAVAVVGANPLPKDTQTGDLALATAKDAPKDAAPAKGKSAA